MSLREAAKALLDKLAEAAASRPDSRFVAERQALRAALAAPPPGPDELRAKLYDLCHRASRIAVALERGDTGRAHDGMLVRDTLIAAILDLWPRRDEDDLK